MKIHESGEMYLKTIILLKKELKCVRSINIANAMHVTRASASRALKQLKESNYIVINESGCVDFLPKGEQLATSVYERHIILTQFFEKIGVDTHTASQDACKIEHVISPLSFSKVKEFLKLI